MFNFDFFTFWAPFWRFWEPLGPLLGGFGPPKCAPRAFRTLRGASLKTFLVFVAALATSFDLEGFGYDFGRVLGRFGMELGRFGEGFWLGLRIWGKGFQQHASGAVVCLVA